MDQRSSEDAPTTFRRIVLGVLVACAVGGWAIGPKAGETGFLLFFVPLVMSASFYGRAVAVPAAVAVLAAQWSDFGVALGLAGATLVIGERTENLRRRLGRFAHRSFTDRLTGLFNFDFLQAQVRYEVDRVRRYGGSCSLIVLDLDHFKKFNDSFGHQAGNLLLRAVADVVRVEKRDSDFAARFGGEELVVLVPGEANDAMRLSERIRQAISELELPQLPPEAKVTASFGVASFPEQAESAAELFERADQALYVAKSAGRDRCIVYPNVQIRRKSA
jgi:diguanylate cyclase (GGDEF)-like protein